MSGGPIADLDNRGQGAILLLCASVYLVAQLVLLGVCAALAHRLGPGSTSGLLVGWVLGLAVSLFYLCGGV